MSGSISRVPSASEPSALELIERARALVPNLRARAAKADVDRRISDETIRELMDAELFRIVAPRRFGGFEAGFSTLVEVGTEIGRGCGSTAWLFSLLCNHHWILGHFPLEAQKEVYDSTNHAFFPQTVSGKGGIAKPVDGGYIISGQWAFSTGIDFSDWVSGTATLDKENPHPLHDRLNFLMPKSESEVLDTWFTAGMRGTGSRDFRVKDVFVPAHRILSMYELQTGKSPGRKALAEYTGMASPYFTVLLSAVLGPLLGLTARTIEEFTNYTKTRAGIGGVSHVNRSSTQMKLGYAQARFDAMQRVVRGIFEEMGADVAAGRKVSAEQRMRNRRDAAYVGDECAKIVDYLISAAGSRGQHESSVFQLIQRDVHTIRTHVVFDLEDATESYGRQMLGLPIEPLRF